MKLVDKDYPVTTGLLWLTGLVFGGMLLLRGADYSSTQTVFDFGGMYGRVLQMFPSQAWRLVTAIFVHIGLEHFAMNMLTLYFIGRQAESIFGSLKFLLLYLLSGIMGNLFVFVFTPNSVAAGASSALFGVLGSIIMLRYAVRNPYIKTLGQSYLSFLVVNLLFSLMPGISLAGHLGGAGGGALCAVILSVKGERAAYSKKERLLALVIYLGMSMLLLYLGFGAAH